MKERRNEAFTCILPRIGLDSIKTAEQDIINSLLTHDPSRPWIEQGKFQATNLHLFHALDESAKQLEEYDPQRFDSDFFHMGILFYHRALREELSIYNKRIPTLGEKEVEKALFKLHLPYKDNT